MVVAVVVVGAFFLQKRLQTGLKTATLSLLSWRARNRLLAAIHAPFSPIPQLIPTDTHFCNYSHLSRPCPTYYSYCYRFSYYYYYSSSYCYSYSYSYCYCYCYYYYYLLLGGRGEGEGGWPWSRRSKNAQQENKGRSTSQEQKQVQNKNRNKNNTFQSDTPAGRRIVHPVCINPLFNSNIIYFLANFYNCPLPLQDGTLMSRYQNFLKTRIPALAAERPELPARARLAMARKERQAQKFKTHVENTRSRWNWNVFCGVYLEFL